jgi:hypothetical protein
MTWLGAAGLLLASALFSVAGFACLALSLPRHWKDVTGTPALPPGRARTLRLAGYPLLGAAGALAVLRNGPSFGSILTVLVWTTSAWAVAFTLTYRPRWLRPLARLPGRPAPRGPSSVASLFTAIVWLGGLGLRVVGLDLALA